MPTSTTTTSTTSVSTLSLTGTSTTTLTDGTLTLRYALSGGTLVFECCGQTTETTSTGRIALAPELWRAWLREGLDLVVEPAAPSPTLLVRLTDASGRDLLTTDGEPTPVSATARLRAHVLFADTSGMSFKIALDGAGAAFIDLADLSSSLRPPPPRLPPDPPKPN